jgi:triacylglycerol esterase/lipase EstA (alpha/beta hydrolase family)
MRRATVIAAVLGALALPATASAVTYAPVSRPGPALAVPQERLDASLACGGPLAGAAKTPVLLVHGTGSDPDHNFSWNWEPALDALEVPWCTVALPANGMEDVQVGGEYIVNAIRKMNAQAGRTISIVGHSQGGMIPRWALRFWPDTRAMVDDVIGLAPSNHGTDSAQLTCIPDCAPAVWQQRSDSQFVDALNSGQETFAGVSYTQVYTHTDPIVTPNLDDTGSSSLHTGDGAITNVAIQDVCPTDVNEHLQIGTVDNVAYSLAIDALTHAGPADATRLDPTAVCTQPFQPGVNVATAATDELEAGAALAQTIATSPHVAAEPPLACYVTASCPAKPAAAKPAPHKKKHKKKKHKKKKHKRKHRRG